MESLLKTDCLVFSDIDRIDTLKAALEDVKKSFEQLETKKNELLNDIEKLQAEIVEEKSKYRKLIDFEDVTTFEHPKNKANEFGDQIDLPEKVLLDKSKIFEELPKTTKEDYMLSIINFLSEK